MVRVWVLIIGASLVLCAPATTPAQARQPYSIQASALYTTQELGDAGSVGGAGVEVQARFNPGRFSYGLGVQFSHHQSGDQSLDLSGVFFEPRFAISIGSDRVTPYMAGRVVLMRQNSDFVVVPKFSTKGFGLGLGGGVLVHLTSRVNFDLGAAYLRQSFSDKQFDDGGEVDFSPFNGYVAKAGFTFGFGTRSSGGA
jgi:opacity protein-like surface antigen